MAEYILVNGARVEREFFDDNLAEARGCTWKLERVPASSDHHHCLVCGIGIESGAAAYRSGSRWLGKYCYDHFLEASEKDGL